MYAFDSWICPMVKALISYKIIRSYCYIYEVLLRSTLLIKSVFIFHVEGPKCNALTQLMNSMVLYLATADLCHFIS